MLLRRALPLVAALHPGSEIAATCGFYDQAHFNSEFKAMANLRTPSQFAVHRDSPWPSGRWTGSPASSPGLPIPGLLKE